MIPVYSGAFDGRLTLQCAVGVGKMVAPVSLRWATNFRMLQRSLRWSQDWSLSHLGLVPSALGFPTTSL